MPSFVQFQKTGGRGATVIVSRSIPKFGPKLMPIVSRYLQNENCHQNCLEGREVEPSEIPTLKYDFFVTIGPKLVLLANISNVVSASPVSEAI